MAAVLPALNEAAFIGWAVQMLPRDIFDDVIVVDDGSTDRTAEEAEASGASTVVRHPVNRGVGAALVTGFRAAVERGNDVAVVIPGDGQADLDALVPMLEKTREGYGLVIADRLTGRDATAEGMPRYRVVGSRILAGMTWFTTGRYVADPQSGYTALRREAIERIPLDDLYERWGIHNDVLSYCAVLGIPVATVAAHPVYRTPTGERITSHIKLWDLIPRHVKVFTRMLVRRVSFSVQRLTGQMPPPPAWPVGDVGRRQRTRG